MSQLLDMLRREHRSIAGVVDALDRQLLVFGRGEQPDYDVITAAVQYFEGFPDRCHHPKEDLVFNRLRGRDPAAARRIGDLAGEHAEISAATRTLAAELRAILGEAEFPRDEFLRCARGFIDQQRRHLAMEEAEFFPAAENALSAQDWSELAAAAPTLPDPLSGARADEKFEKLCRHILAWQSEDETADAPGGPATGPPHQ